MKYLIALLLLCHSLIAAEETEGFETDLNFGLNLTRGNSQTMVLTSGAETRRIEGPHEFTAELDYRYGRSTTRPAEGGRVTNTTQDVLEGETQYNHLFSKRTYALFALSGLRDEIAEIDYRLIAGPGIGYFFLRDEVNRLSVEVGASYLAEEVRGEKDDYFTGRIVQRYERTFNRNASVWQSLEYLPELEDFENYLVNAEIGARARLNGNLSLRIVAQNRYDNTPGEGKKNNDVSVVAGISYRL